MAPGKDGFDAPGLEPAVEVGGAPWGGPGDGKSGQHRRSGVQGPQAPQLWAEVPLLCLNQGTSWPGPAAPKGSSGCFSWEQNRKLAPW